MENVEIAHVLIKYADLMEIEGEDLFRIIAYRNAARTIESLSPPIAELIASGQDVKKLKLPGIGRSMADHVEEIVKTGTLAALVQLRKKLPGNLDELLEIGGLGRSEPNNFTRSWGSPRSKNSSRRSSPGNSNVFEDSARRASARSARRSSACQTVRSVSSSSMSTSWSVRSLSISAKAPAASISKSLEATGAGWRSWAISISSPAVKFRSLYGALRKLSGSGPGRRSRDDPRYGRHAIGYSGRFTHSSTAEIGVKIAINTDAHSAEQLRFMSYGVDQPRRGWLEKRDVLNSMTRIVGDLAQAAEAAV